MNLEDDYEKIKAIILEECNDNELFEAIDDTDKVLKKFTSFELLEELLFIEDEDWILDNLSNNTLDKQVDFLIDNIYELSTKQTKKLINAVYYLDEFKVLPTDNILDLAKAEFITENWDKIKIENINL